MCVGLVKGILGLVMCELVKGILVMRNVAW